MAPSALAGAAAEPGRKPVGLCWGFSVVPLWVLDGSSNSAQRCVRSTSPPAVDGGVIGGVHLSDSSAHQAQRPYCLCLLRCEVQYLLS